jgi:hypothetical protein
LRSACARRRVEPGRLGSSEHRRSTGAAGRYVARLQDATRAKEEAIARSDEEIRHDTDLIRDVESKLAKGKATRKAGK